VRTVELPGRWDDARVVEQVLAWRARPGLVWLDGDGSRAGRWSWIACAPDEVVEVEAGGAPLDAWRRFDEHRDREADREAAHVPRWIGWIAYDALWDGALDGHAPRRPSRTREGTMMRFARHSWVIGVDHAACRAYVVADDEAALERWRALDAGVASPSASSPGEHVAAAVTELHATPADDHRRAIESARAAIARGELYQVNLARRWEGRFDGDPLALALAMRRASPVPLGIFARTNDGAVIGRSMERFLHWDRELLETCPIKGTIARASGDHDRDPEGGTDTHEASALRGDPKEHAEHAMIVDLLRNDLARVARTGTVEVVDPLRVEPYAKLHHLVTTVRARTRPELGLRDVVAATFPPGSVTGAPKVAAVELIDALEPFDRGLYCGAYGYVTRAGHLSLAVAIRTAVIAGARVRYFAGGGIVWPSDAEREVAETELKARVFLDAVESLARSR
jgi:para-aminobenzoate synthetase component 1